MDPAIPNKYFLYTFYVGLALVMLSLWMWFIPDWLTFLHTWRVELFASVFLFATLLFLFFHGPSLNTRLPFSKDEQRFILLPILAFILWSGASAIWAPSWRSAIHHTVVWAEYLIFYSLIRYFLELKGQYKWLLYVFTGTLLLYSLPAIAGFAALSLFGGTNHLGIGYARFGEQVLSVLPLILVAVVRLKERRFVFGLIVVTVLGLFIFSTFGRTNYVLFTSGVIATGGVIFLFQRFREYRGRFAVTVTVMIAATLAMNSLPLFSFAEKAPATHRFQNNEALRASNDFRKLMMSLSLEMISTHPIVGIGADNFGSEVNRYREEYALRKPNDSNLSAAESQIPERAHNEYLQIFAELGTVGAGLFVWFLSGFAIMGIRCWKRRGLLPLHAYAALVGIALFLASSLVTSYSFRLIQNGFVFFFVLAVAAKLILRRVEAAKQERPIVRPVSLKLAAAAGVTVCLVLTLYTSTRVASVIVTQRANSTEDLGQAAALYETAAMLDSENPEVIRNLGMRLFRKERYAEAANALSRSVSMGLATSTSFSYLASAQSLAGDNAAAEETMKKAALYYPHSIFVLARYSSLLKQNGKDKEAEAVFARATRIDVKAAKTWQSMIDQGAKATSDRAVFDEDILPVMELLPNNAIYAVNIERLIRFPEERKFSMMQVNGSIQLDVPRSN